MDRTIEKRKAKNPRPVCQTCFKDLKRAYTYDTSRKMYVAHGWVCKEDKIYQFD